jgi:TPR repeat protein
VRAAESGSLEAQTLLAGLYISGSGVPHDLEKAKELLQSAASKGYMPASMQLERMNAPVQNLEKKPDPLPIVNTQTSAAPEPEQPPTFQEPVETKKEVPSTARVVTSRKDSSQKQESPTRKKKSHFIITSSS